MHLLLDENIANGRCLFLRTLEHHLVVQARDVGWGGIANGDLIARAEEAGFDVLVTADQRIRYQQNLVARQIGLVVLSTPSWPVRRGHLAEIGQVVDRAERGCFLEITLPRPPLRRRPGPPRS